MRTPLRSRMLRARTLCLALAGLAMVAPQPAAAAGGATGEVVDRSKLRVCADPGNLPYSNDRGEGFENKIAELIAEALGVPLEYTWFPQTVGFVRMTLAAKRCDLIIGVATGVRGWMPMRRPLKAGSSSRPALRSRSGRWTMT